MDESNIGYIFVFFGALSVIMRGGVLGRLVSVLGEYRVMRAGAAAIAIGLLSVPLPRELLTFLIVMGLVPIGTALLFPSTTGLLTRRGSKPQIGQLLGVQQAFGGFSRIIGPILAGAAYRYLGPPVPFVIAGIIMCLVVVLTTRIRPISHQ
jgi:MFS family permease